jgi:hypothetical protein
MKYPDQPQFLLDDATSPPAGGGAPSPAPSSPPDGGAGGAAPTRISRLPDSPDEPATPHDQLAGMEDNDFDVIELPQEEPPQAGEAGEAPQAVPPAAQPQPATAPAQVAPQATPAPQAPAAYAPPPVRMPLDQAIEGFRTSHKELSNWASQNLFTLSKEDAELLETDAVAAIPQLMGRVYSQALQATTNLIKNFVPEMINQGVQSTNARNAKANEALTEFYAAHQHLNPQQHGALVDKWARAFRAANPSASRADAIKFVGNAVTSELGMTSPAAKGRVAPFAPARPGTRVQQPSPQHDPYEGMDMEYDQH